MELTPEMKAVIEICQDKIREAIDRIELKLKPTLQKLVEDLDIPDTRNLASKKYVADSIAEGIKPITEELTKTNEAVTKIATETDTKINELAKKSNWSRVFKTILDKD